MAEFWNKTGLDWSILDHPSFYELMLVLRPDYAAKGLIKSNDPRRLPAHGGRTGHLPQRRNRGENGESVDTKKIRNA